jgi:hypothetical protein
MRFELHATNPASRGVCFLSHAFRNRDQGAKCAMAIDGGLIFDKISRVSQPFLSMYNQKVNRET